MEGTDPSGALRATVAWESAYPEEGLDAGEVGYAAEDTALQGLTPVRRKQRSDL